MAKVTRHIGLSLGADICWPICYEEIVRRQRDPALLTLAGHGLVRAQVFPIQPGETRKVVLRYTQLLDRAGDALRLRYALGTRGGESGSWKLTLPDEAAFGTPYSPTHQLTTARNGSRLEITVDTKSGGDIELLLPLRRVPLGPIHVPVAHQLVDAPAIQGARVARHDVAPPFPRK